MKYILTCFSKFDLIVFMSILMFFYLFILVLNCRNHKTGVGEGFVFYVDDKICYIVSHQTIDSNRGLKSESALQKL